MDHYERLGLTREADPRAVARAFRRAARDEHPDRGGDAERFRALEEAYRVLVDPALRQAYDRALDGAAHSWDDVEWGVEVAPARPPDPAPEPMPGDAEPEPTHDGRPDGGPPLDWDDDPGWGGGTGDGVPGAGGRLDPFVGGPVPLPDPLAPVARAPVPGAARRELAAAVVAGVLLAVALACRLIAVEGPPGPGVADVGEDTLQVPIAVLVVLAIGLVLHVASLGSPGGEPIAWLATAFAALGWFQDVDVSQATAVMWVSLVTGPASVVPAVVWARRYRDRTRDPGRLAALSREALGWRIDRHHRAEEWNRVREVLQVPGRTVLIVGPVPTGPDGRPVPGRRWTFDPLTGRQRVRVVGPASPRGSWIVVDRQGRVVATAPAWSPEAWLDVLTQG